MKNQNITFLSFLVLLHQDLSFEEQICIKNQRHCMKSEFLCSLWQRKETFMPLYGQL